MKNSADTDVSRLRISKEEGKKTSEMGVGGILI